MKRICAYCGKYMGEKPPFGGLNHEWDKAVTHGICPTCMAKEMGKIDKHKEGVMALDTAELARCYICGYEGEYGVEVVEVGCVDATGADITRPMCKDYEACNKRFVEAIKCKEEL